MALNVNSYDVKTLYNLGLKATNLNIEEYVINFSIIILFLQDNAKLQGLYQGNATFKTYI